MAKGIWKKRSSGARRPREEQTNRDGYWTRHFSVRADPWIAIESWAAEHGFGLAAMRGAKRRLYQKEFPSGTVIYAEIREQEGQVTLSSWIQFGFLSRLFHLFCLPPAMNPSPDGLMGVLTRRHACRDLNALLDRMRQPAILGSGSFHLADLDPSTLLLFPLLLLPVAFFLIGSLPRMEITPAILPALFSYWVRRAGYLFLLVIILPGLQEFLVVRWLNERWMKGATLSVFFLGAVGLSIFCLGQVNSGLRETRLVYHCLQSVEAAGCARVLESMSPHERAVLFLRLQALEKQLSVREPLPGTPR